MKEIWIDNWSNFKDVVMTNKNLLLQYVDEDKWYEIFAIDGQLEYKTRLVKSNYISKFTGINVSQAQSDISDFETNYKDNANEALEKRTTDGLPRVAKSTYTDDPSLYLKGGKINISPGSTGKIDFQFAFDIKLVGAIGFWKDADVGDYIEFSVGYYAGEDWVEVSKYGNTLYIMDTDHVEITGDDSTNITSGVIVRAEYYNSSSSVSKDFICWIRAYKI